MTDFARTKIQPPRPRAALVSRERLARPLAAALAELPLTLLVAPAGFGKTVALTQQLSCVPKGTALAWIAIDSDDDLTRFAACLVAALEPYDLPWRVSPDALVGELGSRPAARAALAIELINALSAADVPRGLIVVDDLHRADDDALLDLLQRLVERMPRHWGLVIASRIEPALPIARWRAQGLLAEFRQDRLRFTAEETAALAQARGRQDGAALFDRTGGWAAGLGLLLGSAFRLAADGPAAAGALRDREMFAFLASEVLDQMPGDLRTFLLECSVLPELTAARCAQVSGLPQAARLLDEVDRRGLFVTTLDEVEPTLRLHDLFRDFLEDRLRRERPQDWPTLLGRAAAGEPDPVRRIGLLARAEAWAEAEAVLFEIGPRLIAEGALPQVRRLVAAFPAAWCEASAALQHLRGLCSWASWDWDAQPRAFAAAAAGHERRGEHALAWRARTLGLFRSVLMGGTDAAAEIADLGAQPLPPATRALLTVATCWHHVICCELDRVADPLGEVVRILEGIDSVAVWFECMPPTALLGLPGTRPTLQRFVTGALQRVPEEPPSTLRVLATALQSGIDVFAGRPGPALERLAAADADNRWLSSPPMTTTYIHTVAMLAHAIAGDAASALAAAQALLDGLADRRSSGRPSFWLGHYLYMKLRVAAIVDDAEVQVELADRLAGPAHANEAPVFVRQRSSIPARLAAIEQRWHEAAAGFEAALADETALDHYGQACELRARWAAALLHGGRVDDAARALSPAFERRWDVGEMGPILFAGPAAIATLAGAAWGARLPAPWQAWLREAATRGQAAGTIGAATSAPPHGKDHGLSPREWEVLGLMSAGESNKVIARALGLSPHTVKRHVANILDKLALNSRGQAADWHRRHDAAAPR